MHAWLQARPALSRALQLAWLLCAMLGCCCSASPGWPSASAAWLGPAVPVPHLLGWRDTRQRRHSVLRNYPVIGHLRFLLEFIRPRSASTSSRATTRPRPSRASSALVYQRAKGEPDKRPFGTQLDVHAAGYEWINHSLAPTSWPRTTSASPSAPSGCTQPYSASVFNISAMSFGALSANAILALNGGAKKGGFAHDTGEGSISQHHRVHGGDLIWEIGSGYFGCRNDDGRFNAREVRRQRARPAGQDDRAQAQPGRQAGPRRRAAGAKVTPEIAAARGVPVGEDCNSARPPQRLLHAGRDDAVHRALRELSAASPPASSCASATPGSGSPSARRCWRPASLPDFIVVDGAEGGTGAAPLEFTDHVGAPLQEGLLLVHNTLVGLNLRDRIKIGAPAR
jgi:hypothetical protein